MGGRAVQTQPKAGSLSLDEFNKRLIEVIPAARRYAYSLTSMDKARGDDLLQEALHRAVSKYHLFDSTEGGLQQWLFTIVHSCFVNDLRKWQRSEGINHLMLEDVMPSLGVEERATARLIVEDMRAALKRMPEEQRQVIVMIGYEGMNYEEVASVLQVPVGTVRSRLSRGRAWLRSAIGYEESSRSSRNKTAEHKREYMRKWHAEKALQRKLAAALTADGANAENAIGDGAMNEPSTVRPASTVALRPLPALV